MGTKSFDLSQPYAAEVPYCRHTPFVFVQRSFSFIATFGVRTANKRKTNADSSRLIYALFKNPEGTNARYNVSGMTRQSKPTEVAHRIVGSVDANKVRVIFEIHLYSDTFSMEM